MLYLFLSLHHMALSQTDMKNENQTFMASVQKKPASVIEGVICFFSVWSILGLAGFHTYLTTSNQTTNEDVSLANNGETYQKKDYTNI